MLFIPGVAAVTAYELGQLAKDEQIEQQRLEGGTASPAEYEHILQKMEDETLNAIEDDEAKLKKEAKKIVHLQEKIEKEERKYVDLEQELVQAEKTEALLEAETLKKAEDVLAKLEIGEDDKSPTVEKIEEAFHDAKDYTKHILGNVADFAHLMFADDREIKRKERAIERGEGEDDEEDTFPTGKYDDEVNIKTEKKLNAAAKRIEDLQKKLLKKRNKMIEADDELLEKEAGKIERLQKQLDEEEHKYAKIAAQLEDERQYEARIIEEERNL